MKNAKVSIRPAEIASVKFNNQFKAQANTQLKLQIKCGMMVGLNPNNPTNAMVKVKFEAKSEDETVVLEVETISAVMASTYIDNFEEVLKKNFGQIIIFNANEKIRVLCQTLGINVKFPPVSLPYGEQEGGDGDNDSLDDILKNFGKI